MNTILPLIKIYYLHLPNRPIDEKFAVIDGFSNYMASNYGLIYCISENRIMPTHYTWSKSKYDNKKYEVCVLKNDLGETKNGRVNRLVLMAFNPKPNYYNLEANHKNLITEDNRLCNLEWLDHLGNVQDYYRVINNYDSSELWTNEKVHLICKLLEQSKSYQDICTELSIEYNMTNVGYISSIRQGNIRTDISNMYNFPTKLRNTAILSDDEIHQVCKLIVNGYSNKEIPSMLGYNYPTGSPERESILRVITKIKNKSRFTRISDQYF